MKLLIKFFSRPDAVGHLRGLAEEFGDSTNSVRVELQKLEETGLLHSYSQGQKVVYRVNQENPFYSDLVNIISKHLGFDKLVDNVLRQVGSLDAAFVVGDYALGIDSGVINLVLVGNLNKTELNKLITRTEIKINRKIKYEIYNSIVPEIESHHWRIL